MDTVCKVNISLVFPFHWCFTENSWFDGMEKRTFWQTFKIKGGKIFQKIPSHLNSSGSVNRSVTAIQSDKLQLELFNLKQNDFINT